jgi:hypothetical protein
MEAKKNYNGRNFVCIPIYVAGSSTFMFPVWSDLRSWFSFGLYVVFVGILFIFDGFC